MATTGPYPPREGGEGADALGAALIAAAPAPPPGLAATVLATIEGERQAGEGRAAPAGAPYPLVAARGHRAAPQTAGPRPPRVWWWPRWRGALVGLALAAGLGVAGAGASSASAQALPGDPLYALRATRERLALSLAPGAAARDALALGLAQARLGDLGRALRERRGAAVTGGVLGEMMGYNRAVSRAHLPWLRDALTGQYRALQGARRQVSGEGGWGPAAARATERDLDAGLADVRGLARQAGAAWARVGRDDPPQEPAPDE